MKKSNHADVRIKLQEQISRIKSIMGLNESNYDGKTLINVDIQPEYQKWVSFDLSQWANMVNNHKSEIVFLYNGADTMGMISETEYQDWLIDLGINEDIVINATFYDKGYTFFRYCIDNNIEEQQLIDLIKFMIEKEVTDSRDLDREFWNEFILKHSHTHHDIRYLLELSDDCINIPELMHFLRNYNNIVVCGGGANECLKEVEIALHALDKSFDKYDDYVYEENQRTRNIMDEEEIIIPDDPNLMHFFHGGNLDEINTDIQQKASRQKFGAGLYLTTNYNVVLKYNKGSRKLYLVSVQKGNSIDEKIFTLEVIMQFLNTTYSKPKVKQILEWLNYKPLKNNEVPGYLINNILINHNLLTPKISNEWKNFLVQNGVDYELVENAFGWGETMMVLYNNNLIKHVKRINPKDKLPTYDLKKIP